MPRKSSGTGSERARCLLTAEDKKLWRKWCAYLKRRLPVKGMSIRVNLPPSCDNHAECQPYVDRLGRHVGTVIRLGPWLDMQQRLDALCHEYAHALNVLQHGWEVQGEHDATWGVQYARCYRALIDELPLEEKNGQA